jgi:hypothetical protein
MNTIGQPERATQNRVLALFRAELGYRYLDNWTDCDGNSNVEEEILSEWLAKSGYTQAQISAALYRLRTEADNPVYNNLKGPGRPGFVAEARGGYTASGDPVLDLAIQLDATVKQVRPDGWRGIKAREQVIKEALYQVLHEVAEVEGAAGHRS